MKPSASATLVCSVMLAALALAIDAQAAQGLSQVRDKWIGQSAGRLIAQHGYPDNVIETQEGRKVYAYVKTKRRLYSVPIYVPPEKLEEDRRTIEALYLQEGYPDAVIRTEASPHPDSGNMAVSVTIE